MVRMEDLDPHHWIQWCPGCGNFGIVTAMRKAIADLDLDPKDVVVVSGIGCSGKTPHYVKTYGFEAIHGRAVAVALGIKLANPQLHVIVNTGDGDNYGIGLNHWIQNMRRNLDVLHIAHNNHIYALTKGQAAPTTPFMEKTSSTPHGNPEKPLNPLLLALSAGATFVARGYAGDLQHLTELMKEGLMHRGYAFIDVLQPCVSMYPKMSYDYYKEHTYYLKDHDPSNKEKAMELAMQEDDKLALGVFYKANTYSIHDFYEDIHRDLPASKQDISNVDINDIIEEYL